MECCVGARSLGDRVAPQGEHLVSLTNLELVRGENKAAEGEEGADTICITHIIYTKNWILASFV